MRYCPNCGCENPDNVKFCGSCGNLLLENSMQQFQQVQYDPNTQPIYQPQVIIQPQKNNKLSVTGFVLSLCGLITCGITAIPGLICSIIGLIQANKKKENGKGFAIAGIAIGVVCIILTFAIFSAFADITNKLYAPPGSRYEYDDDDDEDYTIETTKHTSETTEWTTEPTTEPTYQIVDTSFITNVTWVETQANSCLIFTGSTFNYYQTYKDLNDNYYTGTYNIYVGEEAIDKVTNEYSQYGVTRQELDEFFAKSSVTKDSFVCILLNNTGCWQNGQNTRDEQWVRPFYGFYMKVDNHYEMALVQMNTGDYYAFVNDAYYKEHYMAPKETAQPSTVLPTETSETSEKGQASDNIMGDNIVGYVTLPDGNWQVWKEADGNDSLYKSRIQKINVNTGTVIQLSVFNDKVSASSLSTVAENLKGGLASSCPSITSDNVKIAGYDAYIITGKYSSGTNLSVIVFVDDNSYLHYISIEYTDSDKIAFDTVKNTYTL